VYPSAPYRSIQPRQLCGGIHNPWIRTIGVLSVGIVNIVECRNRLRGEM